MQQFIDAVRRTQWLRPADLLRYQRPLLDRMLRHAATQTDFYPKRLAPLFRGGDPATAPLDEARWLDVPILRRADLMENVAELKARSVPQSAGPTREAYSSGTTGKHLEYVRSAVAALAGDALMIRTFEAFGFDGEGTLAHIVQDKSGRSDYPHGSETRGWKPGGAGRMLTLDNRASAAEQLAWLERVRPDYVMTYANSIWAVAKEAQRIGGATAQFKAFVSVGEMLEPAARAEIAEVFGCRVIDIYGSREFGPLAFECPVAPGYHVCSETVLFELLDDDNRPVGPGEQGRVVVTSLYNFALPFIRYDLADYAVVSRVPCPCGRGLPRLDRIAGRARHLFVMPDGRRVWPLIGALWAPLTAVLPYRDIQLVQTGLTTLEVRFVPSSSDPPNSKGVTAEIHKIFGPHLAVALVPVDRINRGTSGKTELFVSLVPA